MVEREREIILLAAMDTAELNFSESEMAAPESGYYGDDSYTMESEMEPSPEPMPEDPPANGAAPEDPPVKGAAPEDPPVNGAAQNINAARPGRSPLQFNNYPAMLPQKIHAAMQGSSPLQQFSSQFTGTPLQQFSSPTALLQRPRIDPGMVGDPWTTGLFDCGQDQTNAFMTAFFPCVTYGQNAEILDEGQTTCTVASSMYLTMVPAVLSCWVLGSTNRKKMRYKYNLVQAPAEDWTVHLFCPFCALCQEYRELRNRGIDPSLGWMGYLAQQQQQQQKQTSTAAPKAQFMSQ